MCDFKKHVKGCAWNHANGISRLKVGKLGNVKVINVKAAKSLGYCIGITNRSHSWESTILMRLKLVCSHGCDWNFLLQQTDITQIDLLCSYWLSYVIAAMIASIPWKRNIAVTSEAKSPNRADPVKVAFTQGEVPSVRVIADPGLL